MSELDIAKAKALKTARELEYPANIKERICNAQNEVQITNILAEARREL
mgnify:CR=1 FL=1